MNLRTLCLPVVAYLLTGCATSTLYVVRHAEKAGPSGDVPLSGEGLTRAEILKDSLSRKKITGVYSTAYRRTRQTVAPTAGYFRLPVQEYANGDSLLQALAARKNIRVLVAGHSNTVPAMLRSLGLTPSFSGNIPDNQFDNLFEVTVTWMQGRKLRLREYKYGPLSR